MSGVVGLRSSPPAPAGSRPPAFSSGPAPGRPSRAGDFHRPGRYIGRTRAASPGPGRREQARYTPPGISAGLSIETASNAWRTKPHSARATGRGGGGKADRCRVVDGWVFVPGVAEPVPPIGELQFLPLFRFPPPADGRSARTYSTRIEAARLEIGQPRPFELTNRQGNDPTCPRKMILLGVSK